jgi:hypothetical protein
MNYCNPVTDNNGELSDTDLLGLKTLYNCRTASVRHIDCGREIVQDGALCGYELVRQLVQDAAACGQEYVRDGVRCGRQTVTSIAQCGAHWEQVTTLQGMKDAINAGGQCLGNLLQGNLKCSFANTCDIDLSCWVPKTCEVMRECLPSVESCLPKSCEVPKACIRRCDGSGVTLFEHADYEGQSAVLQPGDYQYGLLGIADNSLSSVLVPDGYRVRLYSGNYFTGSVLTLTSHSRYVGDGFNDIVSSAKVDEGAQIFQHAHYEGAAQFLPIGSYNTAALGIGDNALSSLKVPRGLIVELYDNDARTNLIGEFSESASFVGADLNDRASSIRVRRVPIMVGPVGGPIPLPFGG